MKTLFYLRILYCFSLTITFAQDNIDSIPALHNQIVVSPQDSINKYKKLSREAYGRGDLKAFKEYTDTVLGIAISNDLGEIRVRSLLNLAIYYQQTDQYEQSLSKYFEAEEFVKSLPEKDYLTLLIKVNLGNLYNAIGNYDMASSTMKNVISLAESVENSEEFVLVANNTLGTTALHQKDFLGALEYMKKVKDFGVKNNRNEVIIRAMINISDCYLKLDRYQDAIDNSTEALKRFTPKESIESKALAQLTIAVGCINLKKDSEALPYLKEAKEIGISGNFLKIKMDSHRYLAQAYESLDSIQKSLEEQKAFTKTREQYLKTLSKAKRLEIEKESETKSTIIDKQKASIAFLSKQKQFYIFLGGVLVILLIVFAIMYWNKRMKLARESLQFQDDKTLLENENEALKDKLNELAIKIQAQETIEENTKLSSHKKATITLQDQEKYMKRILDYMEEEKPYLDHEIKQSDIADKLAISTHLFSEILNVCFHKNFNNFINLYRVDSAKQLMKNPDYKHYKILAIGYEAGFPSKTSFNRVFKNLVGLTPSEYQKKNIPSIDLENA
ncbi:AraC family transcriptional regulator [Aquimarina algiphila]|uniref:AraC family transcriptional regulator n=1 Tax=Aquimarina algiphila TaxID=2047982 RepID=UPI002490302D|nr:AraC family transcriptional regulator [Aquimarina algiphila]